ncbi:restriction endonuclease subunit S, partial [Saccharothrix algeriensis]
ASSRKSQTDMADYLNLSDIRSLSITVPDRRQQHAIVDILGALDDKIAVNE